MHYKRVLHGMPQKSVLSPILLLVAINDIDALFDGNTLPFVDDTTLLGRGKTPALAEEMAAHLLESSGR